VNTVPVWSERLQNELFFCSADDQATLVWVANLGSIELHTLLCTSEDVKRPTMVALDMDPGLPADIFSAAEVALSLKAILDELGLESFVKTSGSKGLHMYVPLNTKKVTFDDTKAFARELAARLAREDPDRVTDNMRKDLRKGKVFVDWSQNDEHKTTVCVYSLRARAHPTVSTPITWPELKTALKKRDLKLLTFEYPETLKRIEKKGDLFERVLTLKQKLPA
jgi:bifunctional non-homologous end joining protein LigD